MNKKVAKSPASRKWVRIFWVLALTPFVMLTVALLAANFGVFGKLPETSDLENPKSNLATEVITSDSVILGKYFLQNRTNVRFEDLSPNLINALVATEDERYYDHSGIDLRGLIRAVTSFGSSGGASTLSQQLAKMLFSNKVDSKLERIIQKLKEWIIAVRLERQYTKNEIITMYLNRFDFVNNAVGIKSASLVYFNKLPKDLDVEEAALLVGMAKNPAMFNPVRFTDKAFDRRNVVFAQMKRNGIIDKTAYDTLRVKPIELDYKVVDHKEGMAPYFREVLRMELKELFEKTDEEGNYIYHKADGSPYNIYSDGLKVYTTIDSRMQAYAEWAVAQHLGTELQDDFFKDLKKHKNAPYDWKMEKKLVDARLNAAKRKSTRYAIYTGLECANCGRRGKFIDRVTENGVEYFACNAEDCLHKLEVISMDSLDRMFETPVPMTVFSWHGGEVDTVMSPMDSIKYYKSFLQAGLMSMDPHTGYVKAWVGGINYNYFRYDHVKQSKRQVGSSIKPFIYTLAIQNGYSPCHEIANVDYTIHKGQWGLLQDWTPKTDGANFEGMVSLKYGLANSLNNVTAWIMKQFGPQVMVDFAHQIGITSPLKAVPSLCLGVEDISLYEMTGAMSTYANKGLWIKPAYISRIEDKNGNIIVEFIPESREVMTEEHAYVMISLMKGVVDGVHNSSGGKTLGTGMRLRSSHLPYAGFQNPIAGKTGTTQNHSDGWFTGLTPDLVTAVWVGAEEPGIRFSVLSKGMGTNMALPIWGYYMQKVFADSTLNYSDGDFEKPEKRLSIELNCSSYNSSGGSFLNNDSEPNWN